MTLKYRKEGKMSVGVHETKVLRELVLTRNLGAYTLMVWPDSEHDESETKDGL